jgi:hypothetical protein
LGYRNHLAGSVSFVVNAFSDASQFEAGVKTGRF